MTIALIIALLIGGSTSFAAEKAVPGSALYPVKVSVNEEVRDWIAVSAKSQAKWDARRAERRLEEAEKLAAKGELTAKTSADIESRFAGHAKAFEKQIEKMEAKQNTRASFEAHSDFEASLKAHEQVLFDIGEKKESVRAEVKPLLAEVRARLGAVVKARTDTETKVSAEADEAGVSADAEGEFKAAAEAKLKAAEHKISEVRSFVSKVKASLSASVAAEAEAKLILAGDALTRGKAEMEAETYGRAFASFQEAMRVAQEAKLVIASERGIDMYIPTPMPLKARIEGESKTEGSVKTESNMERKDSPGASSGASGGSSAGASVNAKATTDAHSNAGGAGVSGSGVGEGSVNANVGL